MKKVLKMYRQIDGYKNSSNLMKCLKFFEKQSFKKEPNQLPLIGNSILAKSLFNKEINKEERDFLSQLFTEIKKELSK